MAIAKISENPNVADESEMSSRDKTIKRLQRDKESRSKSAQNTKQTILQPVTISKGLTNTRVTAAETALPIVVYDLQNYSSINPALRKLTSVETLQYTYDLTARIDKGLGTPPSGVTDFRVPVYFNLVAINPNFFYESNSLVKEYYNVFQIGWLYYSPTPDFFKLTDTEDKFPVRGRVDWTDPIDSRSLVFDSFTGTDIPDFSSNKKNITKNQLQDIIDGVAYPINAFITIVSDEMEPDTTDNQDFLQEEALDPNGRFTVDFSLNLFFEYYGLGAAYTPVNSYKVTGKDRREQFSMNP